MILGMSSATFVLVHVVISLIGIVAGLVVMFGMLGSKRQPGLTAIFLLFTILTSATGLLIPPLLFDKTLPSHMIGILSLVLLAIACIALYIMKAVRPLALDLPADRAARAVLQRVRSGDPELPQDTGADGGGAGQSAVRTGVWRGAGRRAGVLRANDHRRMAALPAGIKQCHIPQRAQARSRNPVLITV